MILLKMTQEGQCWLEGLILLSEVWGLWVGVGWGLLGLGYSTRLIQPAIIIHFLLIDH